MAHQTWIEATLNGPWGRERQPGIPITVAEIVADGVAAAEAGAAIIHVHAYDAGTSRQRDHWSIYARIIEGIRARVDAIVYPTVPLAGSGYAADPGATSPASRFAHIEELARRGLLEMTVVDPGSVNFVRLDAVGPPRPGFVYSNTPEEIVAGLRLCAAHRIRPGYAIYEPGFTRLGAALAAAEPRPPLPLYRLMFSDEFAWGFPPREPYLDTHLALLAEAAPGAPWMVAGLGVDIRPLVPAAVAHGGHVRVGLEDAPWGSAMTNRGWVEAAVRRVREAGGEPATAGEVRAELRAADTARSPANAVVAGA